MNDKKSETNGTGKSGDAQPNAQVVGQFIKDLSFENPNIARMSTTSTDKPELNVEVNVTAKRLDNGDYESAIEFSAKAENADGVLYELEVVYVGIFRLENIPDEAIEPVLLVNSPMLLFPFVRRVIADVTREGGFPPLFLDPIDFSQLYMARKQAEGAAKDKGSPVS